MPDCSQWDAIADATLKVWRGGGWQLAGFICFVVLIRWWPFKKGKED